ncbi:MAG: YkgJ family cysteine cluster protein [Desulfobulbaceae bacterium]|uniref:YkgJ family cysteine cluster protein n=1 Tax=Candidatus Desulfatifera sulfidica TaxID=2841691 RepID=A0A8J6T8Y2_9BACT|nr:YkgJ family cysteine cluster protein [Candidatus Desulfatifera sulfidica]
MSEIIDIFECQRCGYCCQGETTVSLDEDDQKRMVLALGLSEDEVRERYWRVTGNVVQMKIVDGHCIFYDNGCLVHLGRPWRCGQWPLHPSILNDVNNFQTIKASCPGINQEIAYEEFCRILKELMAEQGNIHC